MSVTENDLNPGSTGASAESTSPLSEKTNSERGLPNDGSYVPRTRLNELQVKIDDLSRQISKQAEADKPKPVPRKELLAKVDAGEISQAEADDISEQQLETRVADQVEKVVKDTATATKLQEELTLYEKTVPELSDTNSELYGNVAKEYQHYINKLGLPEGTSTTLAAVRSVIGPADKLKNVEITKKAGDTHVEISGGGDGGSKNPAGSKLQLTTRQKDHYDNAMRNGQYPGGWDEVREELGFKKA